MTAPRRGLSDPGVSSTRAGWVRTQFVVERTTNLPEDRSGSPSTSECKNLTEEPQLSVEPVEAAVCGALGCRETENLWRVEHPSHATRVLCVEHAEHLIATRIEATVAPGRGSGRRSRCGGGAEQRKRSAADAPRRLRRRGERRENRAEAEAGPLPWGPDPTRSGDRAERGRAPESDGRARPSGSPVRRRRSR